MKVDSKKLKDFMETLTLNATITNILLNFREDGVHTILKSLDNTTMTSGVLNKSIFSDYKPLGEVGVKNVKQFLDKLGSMGGMVNLEIQDNRLMIYSIGTEGVEEMWVEPIVKREFIDTALEEEVKAQFDDGVAINSDYLKKVNSNRKILGSNRINFTCKDKFLTITTGNDEEGKSILKIKCDYKDFNASFGTVIDSALSILKGFVNMSGGDDYPIRFIMKSEDFSMKVIIAPRVESDVVETPGPVGASAPSTPSEPAAPTEPATPSAPSAPSEPVTPPQ